MSFLRKCYQLSNCILTRRKLDINKLIVHTKATELLWREYPIFSVAFLNKQYTTESNDSRPSKNKLEQILKAKIISTGLPLTVADYMKEVLTNTQSGYYMNKDVFGTAGDFITSPEISQMFGELIGVWIVHEWTKFYEGQNIQLVELGPGRGTLSEDLLRVFAQFPSINSKISLHLVEVSPTLSRIQESRLCEKEQEYSELDSKEPYKKSISKHGQDIFWYKDLKNVPEGRSCFIAHEFFDALPIHKFQKTDKGWREILIDVNETESDKFRFVLAPGQTPASLAYLKPENIPTESTDYEVCPHAAVIVQEISKRIENNGGFALLADYGHTGEKQDTFRAFKKHKLHDPLVEPGTADLTADVNFDYLKQFVNKDLSVFGPITQQKFLVNMGISLRLQNLLRNSSAEESKAHMSAIKLLLSSEEMGDRFQFLSIMENKLEEYTPAGFFDIFNKNV